MSLALPEKRLPLPVLQAAVVLFAVYKLWVMLGVEPHADELYYWLWGQHLQLSYFDHPPLNGWLQGLAAQVFGWNLFALRAMAIPVTAGIAFMLYLWSRRLAPNDWRYGFWFNLAVFFSLPLMEFYTTIAAHDRVLILLTLVSVHFFAWFFADWSEGRRDRVLPLYLGAVFLGLAALSKYNGVFLGLGVGIAVLARQDLRSLLRSPHLYLAAALSVAMQFPTLYWNVTEGFASFRYHLAERQEGLSLAKFNPDGLVIFLRESLLFFSPVMLWPLFRFFTVRGTTGFGGMAVSLGRSVFVISSLFMSVLALFMYVHFYWNIVAYVVFFALAAYLVRSRAVAVAQLAYGAIMGAILIGHFSIFPFLPLIGLNESQAFRMYGYADMGVAAREAVARYDTDFVAAPDYIPASQIGWALGDPNVVSLTERQDAFDFWTDYSALEGEDALIFNDWFGMDYLTRHFDSVEQVAEVPVIRFGRVINTYRLFVGRGFSAEPR